MDPSSMSSEQAQNLDDALRRAQPSQSVNAPAGWVPPVNPDASLKELKAIAHTVRTENYNDIGRMLVPYLHTITTEQWHQFLVWTCQAMLGRMELRLYTACSELHRICTTSGKDIANSADYARQALKYQDTAFTPPPLSLQQLERYDALVDDVVPVGEPSFGLDEESPVFPTFDVAGSGFSSLHFLKYAVRVLATSVRKAARVERVQRVLSDWQIKVKDSDEEKMKKLLIKRGDTPAEDKPPAYE